MRLTGTDHPGPPLPDRLFGTPWVRVPAQVVFSQCLVKRVLLTIAYFSDIEVASIYNRT